MNPMEATVYVVDDDQSVRTGLSRLLQSMGLTVKTFASAREFLDQAVGEEPGCLIVDLRMPAMNGLELQEQLMARNLNLPVTLSFTARTLKNIKFTRFFGCFAPCVEKMI